MIELEVAIEGGKDRLSMAAQAGGETVKAPGNLVISHWRGSCSFAHYCWDWERSSRRFCTGPIFLSASTMRISDTCLDVEIFKTCLQCDAGHNIEVIVSLLEMSLRAIVKLKQYLLPWICLECPLHEVGMSTSMPGLGIQLQAFYTMQKGIILFNQKPCNGIDFLVKAKKWRKFLKRLPSSLLSTTGLNRGRIQVGNVKSGWKITVMIERAELSILHLNRWRKLPEITFNTLLKPRTQYSQTVNGILVFIRKQV
ncbi:hypothetical protein SELMODRAFT_430336 [Selaginella moellendorffii]|uniref:Uncharacterized protein n=1 Tax=Selaginella moellendorffii TaxID=88036 RepID=D8T931_SELML|nr:hypothetical protein SELMODRAFT_430336 [Selaginella moellendorffii]